MKRVLSFLIIFISFFIVNNHVFALEIDIKSNNAILYNLTDDTILYEKNADEEAYIASLTKIMTALITIENVSDYNEKVIVTSDMLKEVTYDLSVAGFSAGNVLTYDDILYGIILKSGADATLIAANSVSTSHLEFVKLMNAKAKEIGMNNTHFSNVIGIEGDNHHSTARDMMKLVKYALQNEKFKEVFCTKTYKNMSGPVNRASNTFNMNYVKGAKTGFTDDAGLCLATYTKKGKTEFISVTLGAPYTEHNENFVDTKNLFEYFFGNYDYVTIINKNDSLVSVKNKYGREYNIKSDKKVKLYLKKNTTKNDLTYTYSGEKILKNGTKKGDKIGTLYIKYKDDNLYEISITSPSDINFDFKYFVIGHKPLCILVTLFITLLVLFINLKRIKRK